MKRACTWIVAAAVIAGCGSDTKFVGAGGSGGGGGGGAGGAAMDDAARELIQVEEGAAEVEVSISESQAGIDLTTTDIEQVSLPGGVTAASEEASAKQGGAPLRPVRFDLGRVLRQLAKTPMVPPCLPAPTIERTAAMADCRLLGKMGAYAGGVKVTFSACALPSGAKIDGTVQATAKLALADGATCDLMGLAAKMTHTLETALTVTGPDGARGVWNGRAMAESRFGRGGTSRTTSLDETRQRFAADGDRLIDQRLSGSTDGRLELASMPPAWVVSGSQTSELKILGATLTTTETDVRQTLGCCYPTGGTLGIHVERSGKPAIDKQVVFGATCGQVTIDGTAADLGACR